ncbi:transmembrane protein 179 [Toxorhynchites rutilus septentrionalis]|uniref:transmembrane protein 179 n=1 Tax=Toxorhynchites rutilus septentrionalis TaxID=329112 RepID=UPI0024791FF5|nr:transmembrane protein 179 [Toxorhynchites rutilus septentrionalis]
MALSNVLTLSQMAGHVIALILSLCIFIPLSAHVHSFNGHCLLFATGTWQEKDGLFDVRWASEANCNYPILVGVALFVIAGLQIYRLAILVHRELESSFLALFFDVVFSVSLCAMTVNAAIIITLGFMTWCSDMTERFPSCEIADGQNITKAQLNIQTSGFYIEMGTAQFGAWASFATWVGLSVFALLKLINNHQLRNIKVSMYIERQRLVNEDVYRGTTSEVPTGPGENHVD